MRGRRGSDIDAVMKSAELRREHIAKRARPHLAQEYEDRGATEDADSVTYFLTSHARMCAKGEVSKGFVRRGAVFAS